MLPESLESASLGSSNDGRRAIVPRFVSGCQREFWAAGSARQKVGSGGRNNRDKWAAVSLVDGQLSIVQGARNRKRGWGALRFSTSDLRRLASLLALFSYSR